jgi:branched-chain amino acid transport system substrate-binding protein
MEAAQTKLEAAGVKTVYREIYPPTQTDFSSIAAGIKASGADIVLGGTLFADAIGMVQAFSAINYQPKAICFMNGAGTVGPFKEALGDKVNGIFAPAGWVQYSQATGNPKFVADYLAMFPDTKDIATESAEGYSAAQVVQAAVEATKSLDNTKIAEWLHANKVPTVQGVIGWDEFGRPSGKFLLQQYQGGTMIVVGPDGDVNKTADPIYPKPTW